MDLREKMDVEELSEARWARIEKSVFEQLDREAKDPLLAPMVAAPRQRVSRRQVASVAVVAAIVALAVVFARVVVGHGAAVGEPTTVNPSRIVTGAIDSHLAVGESSIDVAPESTALVTGDEDRGLLVVVDRGGATFDIAPRRGRPAVVVQAGDVRVRVIGTRFTVSRDGDGARVDVEHGTVEVLAHGQTSLVHAGERWPKAFLTTADAPPPSLDPTPLPRALALPSPRLAAAPRAPPVAPPLQESPPATPRAMPPDPTPLAGPSDPAPAPPSPRDLFESASQLEGKDPVRAIAIYEKLAASGGAWGMNALFAWARLEADRGDRGDARRLLAEYLARYPRGPNAADARALLDQLR
jgi:hypothetical protein